MRYLRLISERLSALSTHFPSIVVTGARQVGKTTLLKTLFPKHAYVSLDSYQNAELAENDPTTFLRRYTKPLVIDEVQYAPKLFRHLKQEIDRARDLKGQFILTGSQKFTLMREVSDSLAGRVGLVELEGLSAAELGPVLPDFITEHSAESVLARGMFPELWEDFAIPEQDYYRSYLATYIERDVRQILNVGSLRDFDRFMRAAAARNGQLLNKTEIAKDVGVTAKTINDWLSVLEASNQISLLEPYFGNIGKRLVKSPRIFFNDCGLLCYLLGLNAESLKTYSGIGFIWEAFVYGELRKWREAFAPEATLWFYRDGDGKEVDFIISRGGRLDLIEVKWSETPGMQQVRALNEIGAVLGKTVRSKIVAARPISDTVTGDGIEVVNGFALQAWLRGREGGGGVQ